MPLKEEKEILKQIQKLERTKRQIVEFQAYQEMAQEKKVRIGVVLYLLLCLFVLIVSLQSSLKARSLAIHLTSALLDHVHK
jgi:hypothetical protein